MSDPVPTPRIKPPAIPFIVLGVSLLLTFAAAAYVSSAAEEADRARFQNAIEQTNVAITRRIETYVNLLRAGAGLFATDAEISRKQFKFFVDRLALTERYPGIQGVGVSARVLPQAKDALIKRQRETGMPSFEIRPAHQRDEYHAIIYLEPLDRRNAAAIGYDMFTEPTRRAAMELARDSGAAATSGKVTLVQEIDAEQQAGFLIYTPIYYLAGVPQTLELRRQLLAGFCYAPFRADDLLNGILGTEKFSSGIAFTIYDGSEVAPEAQLYRSHTGEFAPEQARYQSIIHLQVPNRVWTIAYRSRPDFAVASSRGLAGFILAVGAGVSLLLFVLSFSQGRSMRRAEQAARELRISEQALRASESRFRRLVDSNLIGVAFSTTDGKVIDANDEYLRIINRRRDEMLAGHLRWDQLTPPELRHLDQRAVEQLKATGICTPFEKEYERPDGTRVPVLIGVAMLEGSTTHTVAMVLDLTERKKAEQQILHAKEAAEAARADAEAASRLKDEFLATVSHELRTPLNAIFGWSQLLTSGRVSDEELQHGLTIIQRSAKAQAQLIDDLLDVSRIVAGKLRLDMQVVQLATVIEAAIASIRPAADAKGVQITTALDPAAGQVSGDPNRLQQIVWNLVSNAVKFTPRGGRVDITLRREGAHPAHPAHAAIVVSDTGIGVAPQFLPHIFERFRQADASTTRQYGGLGLGLAIVRHLVELHGGSVSVDSAGENQGATFTVHLPLAHAPTNGATGRAPSAAGGSHEDDQLAGVKILLVEDDDDSRELTARMLRNRGADVTTASSAADGFAIFHAFRPEVLISDIGMPGEDGYTLLSRIRALPPESGGQVPAIALTALARPEDRRRALSAGYHKHVPKPADANELATIVTDLATMSGTQTQMN